MPDPTYNSAVDTVLAAVFFLIALGLLYLKIRIENVLTPRLQEKYRKYRYC